MRATIAILATTLLLWPVVAIAQASDAPGAIRWRSETEGGAAIAAAGPVETAADVVGSTQEAHLVLQFKKIPDAKTKEKLQAKGVTLLRYLGDNAFFARVQDGKQAKDQVLNSGLHAAKRIKRNWKLHPRLIRGEVPDYAKFPAAIAPGHESKTKPESTEAAAQEEIVAVYVLFQTDVDLEKTAVPIVGAHGGTVRNLLRTINGAVVWLPSANLQGFADEDAVQWIEPPLPPFSTTNDGSRLAIQANVLNAPPYYLDGMGIQVMVYDGGTAMASHADLVDHTFVRDNSGVSDHATHVAGIIGGTGSASGGTFAGMATSVVIQSFGFEYDGTGQFLYTNPGDLETDYNKAVNTYGVVLANNSIGTNVAPNGYPCDWEGDYGTTDVLIDSIVRGSLGSPMRVIWANGNERGSGRCGIEYRTTAPPACAKNHITVGAINSNDFTMTTFSSWGPTDDGRLKPDVCAPGCQVGGDNGVTSTVSSGGYGVMCGTSMAAPAVTGVSAMLLQDWKAQFPNEPLPTNALLKVLLTHTAMDLGAVGPDYRFGFGAVQGAEALNLLRSRNFTQGSLEHGQEFLYFIPVVQAGASLKATIAWDDVPGAVNTVPELVNDIDIKLISPSGVTYYPWTLDPATPSSPAVRNAEDHRNNIEQVVVDSAEVGSWKLVVRGYSIPSGPQSFSLAASPDLKSCSSAGLVTLTAPKFGCNSSVYVSVKDCDLDISPETAETIAINVSSSSEPGGESVVLTETSPASATFEGSIPTSTTNSPGVLLVANGDTITASYLDADNGLGQTDVTVTATGIIDCQPPVVTGLQITNLTAVSADVIFTSNEPARVTVHYGTSCASATLVASNRQYLTQQVVTLKNLTKNTTYFYTVEVDDQAGNRTTLNNGGACFSFKTLDRQDFFTELFSPNGFDLDGKAMTFIPVQNLHKYSACIEPIAALPISTVGHAILATGDDSFQQVTLAGGKAVPFFGQSYTTFYVGANGYITFNAGDTDYSESLVEHFQMPRISVLFDDLNPNSAGAVKWQQMSDRVVVTWEGVPEYATNNSNTFQVVIRFDGTIQMAWLGVPAVDGLVGLSQGMGLSGEFQESDLSSYPSCGSLPEKAFNPAPADAQPDASVVQTLSWQPGWRASSHELYFGEAADQLTLQGVFTQNTYPLPLLENNKAYFWRVDEVNAFGRASGDLWMFTTRKLKPDMDSDGDVDMSDFALLQLCYSGTNVPQTESDCESAHMDADNDVDADDATLFTNCLNGADKPVQGNCIP